MHCRTNSLQRKRSAKNVKNSINRNSSSGRGGKTAGSSFIKNNTMQTNKTAADAGEIFVQKLTEVMVPAMRDVEASLVKVNLAQEQLTTQIIEIKKEVSQFTTQLEHLEIKAPPVDTTTIEILTIKWYQKILSILENFPKKHSFRILLFPEQGALGYLKKLWRSVFLWLFLIVLLRCVYSLGNKWLDEYAKRNRYKEAWENFYLQQNQRSQKKMDEELNRH
jgi:hypothetical protein